MKKFITITALLLALTPTANAYDKGTMVLGLGSNNAFDNTDANVGFEAEYRFAKLDASSVWGANNVSPYVNINADSDGAVFAGGGILYDANLGSGYHIVPQFGAGLYHKGNNGRNLGGSFNFRSAIELGYELSPDSRVGLQLMHLSHTSLFYDRNPGTENLLVNYQLGL